MAIELETEDNKLQPINLRSWTTNNHSTETELSYCPCNMPKTTNVNVSYIEEKLSAFRSSEIGLTPHIWEKLSSNIFTISTANVFYVT